MKSKNLLANTGIDLSPTTKKVEVILGKSAIFLSTLFLAANLLLSSCTAVTTNTNKFTPIIGSAPQTLVLPSGLSVTINTNFTDGNLSCTVDPTNFQELSSTDPLVVQILGGGPKAGGYSEFAFARGSDGKINRFVVRNGFIKDTGSPDVRKAEVLKETEGNCLASIYTSEIGIPEPDNNYTPVADALAALVMPEAVQKLFDTNVNVDPNDKVWDGSNPPSCNQVKNLLRLSADGSVNGKIDFTTGMTKQNLVDKLTQSSTCIVQ